MVGRPEHYSIIPDLLFKKNEHVQAAAEADARRVFNNDPRVKLLSLEIIQPNDRKIIVIAKLRFEQFNMDDYFTVTLGDVRS